MFTSSKRVGFLAVGLAVLCLPQVGRAQFQPAPGFNQNPFGAGVAAANPHGGNGFFNPAAGGGGNPAFNPYNTASMSSSGGGYGGYGGLYGNPYLMPYTYYGEAGGFLIGASSVINASGNLMLQTQNARLIQEQVRRERITTRRQMIEEWLWERNNLPTLQDEFERLQRISLRRMQNDPPVTEVLSGQALNELLTDIQKHPNPGPDITLNEEMLGKINVTPAGKGVNLGVMKNQGRLSWPIALKSNNYQRDRELLDTLAKTAYDDANKGAVSAALINQMSEAADRMLADLADNIKEMGPNKYIDAKRFLNDVKEASRGLERNDVANFFNNKYAAKGRTIPELVKNMTTSGLKFAPYVSGDESAYIALHRLLAAYDVAVNNGGSVADQRPGQ